MSGRYLTDLAAVAAGAGLTVHEEAGWQTRGRSSGGYSTGPVGIVIHHTASPASWDGQKDVDYCTYQSDIRPICGLYLSRSGAVWVCAAGATNHAGSGGPVGPVPQDGANSRMIGIEAGNAGTGAETWPTAQQDAYLTLVRALQAAYHLDPVLTIAHHEWVAPPPTTGRKIDPAGPSAWATGSASWDMTAFRSDVAASGPGGTPTPPTPTPEPPQPEPPWVCPPFPGVGDYGCTYETCRAWQDAMILNRYISDTTANHDGAWGHGMHNATYDMQLSWGWSDADGIAGEHTWPHLRSRQVAPCPVCGK
jgi:hypothetical protein